MNTDSIKTESICKLNLDGLIIYKSGPVEYKKTVFSKIFFQHCILFTNKMLCLCDIIAKM